MSTELEGRWSLVRGTPVYHRAREVEGAQVILHLHGFAISGSSMVPTAAGLADEFTNHVPDLAGFGRSPRPDQDLDIPMLADSAAALLDAVGAERATVVGNSLGCTVLASFAQRHPDRLERAVMVSPAGGKLSQPLARAIRQLVRDAPREPPSMATLAINYSHPRETADLIRGFVRGEELRPTLEPVDGRSPVAVIHRTT